jgi:NAD(P)-dependent dehydrogenase (short-subunit alcohol dehydrogenase family)
MTMSDLFDLSSKIAIVTGASGGIGRAVAVGLAKHGADVVVTARNLSKLEPVAHEIRSLGRKGMAISADVTDEQSVARMVDAVLKEFSRIDILVNAAGLAIRRPAAEITIKEWQQIMDFNALGTFICCQAVGRVMINQNGGKIVNLSSIRGILGASMGAVAYGPSKGAVDALTRTLACEWGKYNIFVNAIAPSLVMTDLSRSLMSDLEKTKARIARIPLGREAELEDIVGPTIFLASRGSSFITGQIIHVDGGTSAGII